MRLDGQVKDFVQTKSCRRLRFVSALLVAAFSLIFNTKVYSQGLITSAEKLERLTREDQYLSQNEFKTFLGFRPTIFETETAEENSTEEYSFSKWRLKSSSAAHLGFYFAALRERPVKLAAMGNDRYPVQFHSLMSGSQGFEVPYGENGWSKLGLNWRPFSWLHGYGELAAGTSLNGRGGWYHLPSAYIEAKYRKLVFSIGRKPIHWGQSFIGATLIGDNATSLDSLQLSTLPQRWPWLLKYLGPIKTEVFFSRMNAERVPSHDYFVGWRLGIAPAAFLELNAALIYQFGGNGISTGSLSDTVIEIFGGRANTGSGPLDSSNVTNRAGEADFRLKFSDWSWPSSLYVEFHFEDCCGGPLFTPGYNSISHTFGAYVRTGQDPRSDRFRVEFTRTSPKTYYHLTWPSGFSNEGRIMGHPVGRDGMGAYLQWTTEPAQIGEFQTFLSWEHRDRTGLVDLADIRRFRPSFEKSEMRFACFEEYKKTIAHNYFLSLSVGLVRVLNKEDIANRKTYEWGAAASVARAF